MKRKRLHRGWTVGVACCLVLSAAAGVMAEENTEAEGKILGHDRIIALYGDHTKQVPSQNIDGSSDLAWYKFLKNPVDKAADIIVAYDRRPLMWIDEFGWDYDGPSDMKTAAVLRAAKEKKPDLQLMIHQMRGPVAPELARTYRELVDLVWMETYVDPTDLWAIAMQLKAAELNGLAHKSIIALGAGKCARDQVNWATTKEEMEEQMRFVRYVAPESPGIAFFAVGGNIANNEAKDPITIEDIGEICSRWDELPTDGSGLRPELIELGKTFSKRYEKPALVCSPTYVWPNLSPGHLGPDGWTGWGQVVKPYTFRVPILNMGEEDAKNVIVRLRNPGKDGDIFAKGIVDIPARSVGVAILPVIPGHKWKTWIGRWELLVEAPGSKVLIYNFSWYED